MTGFSNAEYDELIAQARKSVSPAGQLVLLRKANAILVREMPGIPIARDVVPFLAQKYVKGPLFSPFGPAVWRDIAIVD